MVCAVAITVRLLQFIHYGHVLDYSVNNDYR